MDELEGTSVGTAGRPATDDRYVVISADMHGGSDLLGYRPYLERRWHDEFDAWAATAGSRWAAASTDSENAAALYGFDLDLLTPVAKRVGPSVAEIHTPLDHYPSGSRLPIYMGSLHPEPGCINGFTGHVQAV
jgi:hypothetical protein